MEFPQQRTLYEFETDQWIHVTLYLGLVKSQIWKATTAFEHSSQLRQIPGFTIEIQHSQPKVANPTSATASPQATLNTPQHPQSRDRNTGDL